MQQSNIELAVAAYREHGTKQAAADSLGWTRSKMRRHLHRAAEKGLLGPAETLPGYRIASMTISPLLLRLPTETSSHQKVTGWRQSLRRGEGNE